jgi:hypothetical protein
LIPTKICIRCSTIETKEAAGIGYSLHLSANAVKETRYIQYGQLILFQYQCIEVSDVTRDVGDT